MQKLFSFFLIVSVFALGACDEISPDVSNTGGNTSSGSNLEDQQRQVFIEEFTGVECINCPEGSELLETLLATHGDQLVAVSIHSGFFSDPYPENQYDFRTDDGDNLLDYVGQPDGYPTAVINRTQFSGESSLQTSKSSWAGHIAAETQLAPTVKIGLESDYNDATRTTEITVTILPQENDPVDNPYLTLMLTESNIVDAQLTPESSPDVDVNYLHKHVLRDIITNFNGEAISEGLAIGLAVEKTFTYNLPVDWKVDDCSIIALVHNNGGTKEVLQAAEVHVTE